MVIPKPLSQVMCVIVHCFWRLAGNESGEEAAERLPPPGSASGDLALLINPGLCRDVALAAIRRTARNKNRYLVGVPGDHRRPATTEPNAVREFIRAIFFQAQENKIAAVAGISQHLHLQEHGLFETNDASQRLVIGVNR